MKKILLPIIAIVIVAIAAFYALNAYIYAEKQEGNEVTSYRGTLTGTQVCLPHVPGVMTKECALGMKTDSGEFYALDYGMYSQGTPPDFADGERFSATGLITPVEMLSSDHWQKYAIEGIFSVTDSVETL